MGYIRKLPNCPRCGSDQSSRSQRKGLERFLYGFKAFRCSNCLKRYLAYSPDRPQGK